MSSCRSGGFGGRAGGASAAHTPRAAGFAVMASGSLDGVGTGGEPVEGIGAVTLFTADMNEAVGFYQALGFVLLYGGPDAAFTSFRVGAGYFNLQLEGVGAVRRELWGRVVFWVDDVDAMYRRALAAGLTPENSPANASWGERYFHLRDPGGHELSFARPLGPK
jgi:catechol 2,3-dioxygenase-like lactoylglutathione lyase family enzyme